MTLRLAIRAVMSRPVRSAVLACGFGFGIAVMADLLGVGEVILEQSRSPALRGGGDLVISGIDGPIDSGRFVLSSVLGGPPLSERLVATSPSKSARLYLVASDGVVAVDARGGIPSLERTIGDPETANVLAWVDSGDDGRWSDPDPADILRSMDRFHAIPDVPERAGSWAEWLYFNGTRGETRFYLSFIVGPRTESGRRRAVTRLQLERAGKMSTYSEEAEIDADEVLSNAPEIRIGESELRLEGLRYRATLRLPAERAKGATRSTNESAALVGEITLDATPGRSLPPVVVRGAGGWVSGYVVPVLSGSIGGSLHTPSGSVTLDGGTGYHDHNWGFWDGVTWRWGQVAHEDLSFVYGRIHPPADAADPGRVPGFLGVLGPEGPLGFATNVRIEEEYLEDRERPRVIRVAARSDSLDLEMTLSVESSARTSLGKRMTAPTDRDVDFLQMRALFEVDGHIRDRRIKFTASGAAETFVDRLSAETVRDRIGGGS